MDEYAPDLESLTPKKGKGPFDLPPIVECCEDLDRILALPQRVWQDDPRLDQIVARMTAWLRTPIGTQTLQPEQAYALMELYDYRGLISPILPGGGKTLISFLAGTVLGATRVTLVIPGGLRQKTIRDLHRDAKHWRVHQYLDIKSYQELGRKTGLAKLLKYAPQVLILDEAHYIKDFKAAVTATVREFCRMSPDTIVIVLSASLINRGLRDCWVSTRLALKQRAPVPLKLRAFLQWSAALDRSRDANIKIIPGPLGGLVADTLENVDLTTQAQDAFGKRYTRTPGVVCSLGKAPPYGLEINAYPIECPPQIQGILRTARETGLTPSGDILAGPLDVHRFEQQLENGFYYRFDPPPPPVWRAARSAWQRAAQDMIRCSRRIFSEGAARARVQAHPEDYPEQAQALQMWLELLPMYDPEAHRVPMWVHDHTIVRALEWSQNDSKGRGLIWVRERELGLELSRRGLPYYADKGLEVKTRQYIADARHTCAVSTQSNAEGRDGLQYHFDRNYMLSVPTTGLKFEQLLGRVHRFGFTGDTVYVEIPYATAGKRAALVSAIIDAGITRRAMQVPPKLLSATWVAESVTDCMCGRPVLLLQNEPLATCEHNAEDDD